MNRTSAVATLGVTGLGLAGAVAAGVVALSAPASADSTPYPPVVSTSTAVEGESTSQAPSSTTTFTAAVEGESTSQAPVAGGTDPGSSGNLPFTGADVAGAGIVGIALVGGGGFLVVASRRRRGAHR